MTNSVVLIEDDHDIRELISFHFKREGYQVTALPDAMGALERIRSGEIKADLLLLDIMLPGISGLDLCRDLKNDSALREIPVVMISARGAESDIVVGLELGADDYVVKPFSIREVLARVRAVLRRVNGDHTEEKIIKMLGITLDPLQYQVRVNEVPLKFTLTEFNLLKALMSRPGQVLTRNQLIDQVLGSQVSVVDRTIDVHIVSVRKKLGELGSLIETVRGVGYRFIVPNLPLTTTAAIAAPQPSAMSDVRL